MIKIINFVLEVEGWCRSQPRKFWRHWKIFFAIFAAWCIAKIGFDALHEVVPFAHYALINVGFYLTIGAVGVWFVRRAYVGMERDHDFYIED